jgi:hypothetical protein
MSWKAFMIGLARTGKSLAPLSKPKLKRGPPTGRRTGLDDETIALIRGDFELRGMRPCEIARKHDLTTNCVYKLVHYETRADVEPK